jgi:GNAT superfamily N-acetyltransferase
MMTARAQGRSVVDEALTFRQCGPADAALVKRIAYECYAPYYADLWEEGGMEAYLGSLYEAVRLASELADPNLRFELAHREAVPVGFAKLHLRCDRAGTANASYLERVYVAPCVTGLGVGRRLIDRSLSAARALGRNWVWLQTMADAAKPLERYLDAGFVECGRAQLDAPRVRSGRRGMLVMRRPL